MLAVAVRMLTHGLGSVFEDVGELCLRICPDDLAAFASDPQEDDTSSTREDTEEEEEEEEKEEEEEDEEEEDDSD